MRIISDHARWLSREIFLKLLCNCIKYASFFRIPAYSFNPSCRLVLTGLVAFAFIVTSSVHGAIIEKPVEALVASKLEMKLQLPEEITGVTIFYRPSGGRVFSARILSFVGDETVTLELPADLLTPPGIEYYFRITSADGQTFTDPPFYPDYNPYQLVVTPLAETARIAMIGDDWSLAPDADVVVALDPAPNEADLRIFLDGADITDSVSLKGDKILYDPPGTLALGTHLLRISTNDGLQETKESFEVSGDAGTLTGAGILTAKGNFSFNYGGNLSNKNTSTSNRTSANLHLGLEGDKGPFRFHFSGINLQYVDGAEPEFNISSGYKLTVQYDRQTLDYGDLSIRETNLVASGFNRRGLQLNLFAGRSEFHLFDVSSLAVEGWRSGLSLEDQESQVYGVSYSGPVPGSAGMGIHLVAVTGKNSAAGGGNTAGLQFPEEGTTVGASLKGKVGGVSFDGEMAISDYDFDTTDGLGEVKDDAYELTLSSDVAIGSLSVGYHRFGSSYASIANPNFTGDRRGWQGSYSTVIADLLSWSLSANSSNDNVDGDPARPTVTSLGGGTSIGFSPVGWPSFRLGYSRSGQESHDEPSVLETVDNLNQNLSLGMSYGRNVWNVSLNADHGSLDDKLPADADVETRNYNLSGAVNVDQLAIAPAFTLNRRDTGGKVDTSRLATVSLSIPFWSNRLNFSTQSSYQHQKTSDDSIDRVSMGGSVRLSWNTRDLLEHIKAGWMNFQLALSAEFSKVTDRIDRANDAEEYTVLLNFNLGTPLNFEASQRW